MHRVCCHLTAPVLVLYPPGGGGEGAKVAAETLHAGGFTLLGKRFPWGETNTFSCGRIRHREEEGAAAHSKGSTVCLCFRSHECIRVLVHHKGPGKIYRPTIHLHGHMPMSPGVGDFPPLVTEVGFLLKLKHNLFCLFILPALSPVMKSMEEPMLHWKPPGETGEVSPGPPGEYLLPW